MDRSNDKGDFVPVRGSPTADANTFITLESGHTPMSQNMLRKAVLGLEQVMLAAPDADKVALETMHNFTDGVYTRTVLMRAGSLITGKIHKQEHIVVVSQGAANVLSEEFGVKHITAPALFVSPPGVKRVLLIHEDMIWTTIHKNPTNTRDISILEAELIAADYSELEEAT